MEPESSRPRPAWPGIAAAAVAIVANVWVLGLDFLNDDFLALTRIPQHFVPEPWIGTDACSGAQLWYHEMVLPVPDRYIFRPATWALWWTLARLGVSAPLFHGSVLAIHALAT